LLGKAGTLTADEDSVDSALEDRGSMVAPAAKVASLRKSLRSRAGRIEFFWDMAKDKFRP